MMLMPMLHIFTLWLDSFDMGLPDPVRWVGIAGFGFGLVLFWRVHGALAGTGLRFLKLEKIIN